MNLFRLAVLSLALLSANSAARAEAPAPLKLREAKAPKALVQKQGRAKILRAVIANLGAKRESCWGLWTARGKKEVSFAVWKPTGKTTFARLGQWKLSIAAAEVKSADMTWLNAKTGEGWVMSWGEWDGTILLAFPRGVRSLAGSLVSDSFGDTSTSISATNYELGGNDPRGFYSITKVYSEPGQDEEGNTITIEERTELWWNGNGWSAAPEESKTDGAPETT